MDDGSFPCRLSDECSLRGMSALICWGSGVSECRHGMLSIPEPAASKARREAEWCTPNAWRRIQVKQRRWEWTAACTTTDRRCWPALSSSSRLCWRLTHRWVTAGRRRAVGDIAEHCASAVRQRSTIWRWWWHVSVSWRHSLCRARDHERKWPVVHKCCRYAQARSGSGADVDWKNTRAPLSSTDWPAAGWTSSRTTLHQCRLTLCQMTVEVLVRIKVTLTQLFYGTVTCTSRQCQIII